MTVTKKVAKKATKKTTPRKKPVRKRTPAEYEAQRLLEREAVEKCERSLRLGEVGLSVAAFYAKARGTRLLRQGKGDAGWTMFANVIAALKADVNRFYYLDPRRPVFKDMSLKETPPEELHLRVHSDLLQMPDTFTDIPIATLVPSGLAAVEDYTVFDDGPSDHVAFTPRGKLLEAGIGNGGLELQPEEDMTTFQLKISERMTVLMAEDLGMLIGKHACQDQLFEDFDRTWGVATATDIIHEEVSEYVKVANGDE